jgi:flagellin-like protein
MKLKNLINDDDAVSPVIGVILMVAITVILAAVIGTFVLGLGDQLQDTSPTTSLSFDQAAGNDEQIEVAHDGGDSLDTDRISFTFDGTEDLQNENTDVTDWPNGDKITAGDSTLVDLTGSPSSGDTLKVVWTSDGSGNSAVIGEYEAE